MNKTDSDVRYQGLVFQGTMNAAIAQARAAPDYDARQTMDSVAHKLPSNVIPFHRTSGSQQYKGGRFMYGSDPGHGE